MKLDIRGSRRGAVVCAGVVAALCGHAAGQVDRFWADAVDGNFTDGARWTPSGTPQQNDNVTINASGDAYTVSLDATSTVNNFALTWADATFNLTSNALGVSGQLTLTDGTFGGIDSSMGSALVGSADATNATMRDFSLFGSQGDVTLTDMTVVNVSMFTVGDNGVLTLNGDNVFQNVPEFKAMGDTQMQGGGTTLICDTCVDFGGAGRGVNMDGDGTSIALEGDAEVNINTGTTFAIFGNGGSIMGDPKSGQQTVTNNGDMVKTIPARDGRGLSTTVIGGLTFVNNGSVEVGYGEMQFLSDTGLVNDQILQGGTWRVNDNTVLNFSGQAITTLGNGSRVSLVGANSQFSELDALHKIDQGSRLGISEGRDFAQFGSAFTNFGELSVGVGSSFFINEFGLTNLSNSILTDGVYEIAGTMMLPSNDQVQFLEASVRLIGPDSVFAAMDSLETVGSQGFFGVEQGRAFLTADDFQVLQGGKVFVGQGSMLGVNGQLVNFAGGVFDDGAFEVAGTLQAPGISINTISNELILDGVGSQFVDESGNDALSALSYIAPDGILRLRNGRSLNNLNSLVVDGVLEIDPGSGGGGGGAEGPGLAQLSTVGDFVLNPGSQLVMVLQGSQLGQGPMIEAGGDALLGGGSGQGGMLSLVLGSSYQAKLGDEFLLIRAASVQGMFEGVDGLDIGGGLSFEVLMTATTVAVRVVPAPGALAVLALGGITATRRRRG